MTALLSIGVVIGIIVIALLSVLPTFVVQFTPALIVDEGFGLTDAIARGVALLRNNLVTTIRFDALWLVASLLVGVLLLVWSAITSPVDPGPAAQNGIQTTSMIQIGGSAAITAIAATILGSVAAPTYISFVRRLD